MPGSNIDKFARFSYFAGHYRRIGLCCDAMPVGLRTRFATIVIPVAAFLAIEKMPCEAGDEFPFGASVLPYSCQTSLFPSNNRGRPQSVPGIKRGPRGNETRILRPPMQPRRADNGANEAKRARPLTAGS
jgi:hypothetical protein